MLVSICGSLCHVIKSFLSATNRLQKLATAQEEQVPGGLLFRIPSPLLLVCLFGPILAGSG
jgi:hypothetical protein